MNILSTSTLSDHQYKAHVWPYHSRLKCTWWYRFFYMGTSAHSCVLHSWYMLSKSVSWSREDLQRKMCSLYSSREITCERRFVKCVTGEWCVFKYIKHKSWMYMYARLPQYFDYCSHDNNIITIYIFLIEISDAISHLKFVCFVFNFFWRMDYRQNNKKCGKQTDSLNWCKTAAMFKNCKKLCDSTKTS